jgi:hypothetical protein
MNNKLPRLAFIFNRRKNASTTTKSAIELRVYYNFKQLYLATGIMLYSNQWKKCKIVNCPDTLQISSILDKLITELRQLILEMIEEGDIDIFSIPLRLKTIPECNVIMPGFEKAKLWCNVTGHSMEPKINHGDIIALRECTVDDIQYGEIYVVVLDTIRTIKILRRGSTPDVLRYVPINTDNFDEQEYPIDRILHVFEVLGSIARFF